MKPGPKIGEVRVNKVLANVVGTLLAFLFCAVGLALARALPNHAAWTDWHLAALLVSLVVLLPVHEGLHALGLLWFARVRPADIRFGIMWHALMPYCGCKVPISLAAYQCMALLPLRVTGAVTVILLVLFPSDWLGLLAGIALSACAGDVWVVAKLRRFTGDLFALDCDAEIGCDVLSALP